MFVNEDCVDSRSDVDDLRTRDCLYDESRPVRYGIILYNVFILMTQWRNERWIAFKKDVLTVLLGNIE